MRGLFVTGTGTGVGKTIVSAALLAAMRAAGESVRAYKPVVTGLDEPSGVWPPDHELLALAAGMDPDEVAPLRYGPAVSPHLAAALAGVSIDPAEVVARARAAGQPAGGVEASDKQPVVVVEGVGGLLVPLANDYRVRDLAVELALPVVIVAPPGLGTINHTLLTIESAQAAGLEVQAVVLTPWPSHPLAMEASNHETVAGLGATEVVTLEEIAGPDIAKLARAGDHLPWRDWFDASDRGHPWRGSKDGPGDRAST
jgi:dethiobiotin synthetase